MSQYFRIARLLQSPQNIYGVDSPEKLQVRVQRGVDYLEYTLPAWRDMIIPSIISFVRPGQDVLGQIAFDQGIGNGTIGDFLREFLPDMSESESTKWATEHGFSPGESAWGVQAGRRMHTVYKLGVEWGKVAGG